MTANVLPAMMSSLTAACERGDYAEARRLHFRLEPMNRAMFTESNPIPCKTALSLMGRMTDEMRLPKRPTKSLKKLFSEQRIPIEERDRAVVLCDDKGIVWVEKLGAAERTAATVFTDKIIKIDIKPEG